MCGRRRRREDRGRLLRDQIEGIRHVERVEGCWTSIHGQIRGVAQVPEVLQPSAPDAFVHEVVVLAEGVVEVEGLISQTEEIRLRCITKCLETGGAQLILFCGRLKLKPAWTGSSRVYGVRGVILGPAGARFHFPRIERKNFRRRFHTGADSMRRWRLPSAKRLRLPSSASGDDTRSSDDTSDVLRASGWPL